MRKSLTTTTKIKASLVKKVGSGDETMKGRGDVNNTSQFPTVHEGGGCIFHGIQGLPTKGRVSKDAT